MEVIWLVVSSGSQWPWHYFCFWLLPRIDWYDCLSVCFYLGLFSFVHWHKDFFLSCCYLKCTSVFKWKLLSVSLDWLENHFIILLCKKIQSALHYSIVGNKTMWSTNIQPIMKRKHLFLPLSHVVCHFGKLPFFLKAWALNEGAAFGWIFKIAKRL